MDLSEVKELEAGDDWNLVELRAERNRLAGLLRRAVARGMKQTTAGEWRFGNRMCALAAAYYVEHADLIEDPILERIHVRCWSANVFTLPLVKRVVHLNDGRKMSFLEIAEWLERGEDDFTVGEE
jgi:hypothetical protein